MDLSKPSRSRFDPRGWLAVRAQRWAKARQGFDTPPLTLLQRRIYILPTKAGMAAAILLFAMLLAGMNYGNSLALFLCFTLSGVALVSMHECHRSLAGLKLVRAQADNSFAGQTGELQLYFENGDTRLRDSLSVDQFAGCFVAGDRAGVHETLADEFNTQVRTISLRDYAEDVPSDIDGLDAELTACTGVFTG